MRGDPNLEFTLLLRAIGLSRPELGRFLGLTAPALDRCMARSGFTRDHRKRMTRLARLLDRASRVLGDRASAQAWITTANRALNFSAPIALLESTSGTLQVTDLLFKIEAGKSI